MKISMLLKQPLTEADMVAWSGLDKFNFEQLGSTHVPLVTCDCGC